MRFLYALQESWWLKGVRAFTSRTRSKAPPARYWCLPFTVLDPSLWVLLPPQAIRALIGEPKEQKYLGIKSTNKELPSSPVRQTRGTLRWVFIKYGFFSLFSFCVCVELHVLSCCSPVFSVQFIHFMCVEWSTLLWRWVSPPPALAAHSDNDVGNFGDQMHLKCREELAVFIIVSIPLNIYHKFRPATRSAEMEIKHSHPYLMKEEGAFKHQRVQLLNETALFRQKTLSLHKALCLAPRKLIWLSALLHHSCHQKNTNTNWVTKLTAFLDPK